jgi:hypothetical protein
MQPVKYQNNKERTVAVPQRIMNKVAISMIPMQKVDRKGFYGYEGSVVLPDGTMTIRGSCNITAQDMRMFHFVLSQWQAMRATSNEDILFVDLKAIIKALGWTNRTENRRKIISHLESMTNTTITFEYEGGRITFSTLDFVKEEDYETISLRVSKTFEESVTKAGKRFINVERTMKIKSGYAMELSNLLQLDGSGVHTGSGIPFTVNSIAHSKACEYLLLEHGTKEALEEVRRAFKSLEAQGYPKYKNKTIRGQVIWLQDGKNISKNSINSAT